MYLYSICTSITLVDIFVFRRTPKPVSLWRDYLRSLQLHRAFSDLRVGSWSHFDLPNSWQISQFPASHAAMWSKFLLQKRDFPGTIVYFLVENCETSTNCTTCLGAQNAKRGDTRWNTGHPAQISQEKKHATYEWRITCYYLGGGFNDLYFHPDLGKWSNLTSIWGICFIWVDSTT